MSEELENSLQQAVDSYLSERLRVIDDRLLRLQSDFEQTLAQVRESSLPVAIDSTPLAETIAAHLQTAREQKRVAPPAEILTDIKQATDELERQQTQTDVLSTLLRSATRFAERVALFVIRNEQAIGWRECEASDPANVESIRGVALPLNSDRLVTRAVKSHSLESASDPNGLRFDELGGEARSAVAIPLLVRGKVVAVLYADSPSEDSSAVNADALELLVRISSMTVSVLAARAAQTAAAAQPETAPSPQATAPAAVPAESVPEPAYTPEVEARPIEPIEPISAPQETVEQATSPIAAEPSETIQEMPAVESPVEPPPSFEQPAAPAPPGSFSAPLGGARTYGVAEPELPIEVGDEERRLHNDARRFARLLVSEIKLYNEQKVRDGRSGSDLYDRLREDIDRSRQMYDKRVAPPVAARHDYFHQELVNTLAEGDPHKLGANYPGAAMVG